MNVLIFGGRGWLGSHFHAYFQNSVGVGSEYDITKPTAVQLALETYPPDVVINCAGVTRSKTIPNIDGCVESSEARYRTRLVNTIGAMNVAMACAEHGIKLVHIGSGCVFNGYDQVFDETSHPNPPSWYAATKAAADDVVRLSHPSVLILRIRMPISATPHPRNLLTKLLQAERVVDVKNTVTVIEDFLPFTKACIKADVRGIVHATHPQPIEFRKLMACLPSWHGEMISASLYKTKDGRSNAVVISSRRNLPCYLPDTEVAVKRAIQGYYGNQK